ncbi:MAG TPA: autotransporter domain-containing protein [Xanthobacteraceae bacterium]
MSNTRKPVVRRQLLVTSSITALLIGGAPAFAACPTSITGPGQPGCTNSGTITGINITSATVTGNVVNSGAIAPNGISLNSSSTISGAIEDGGTLIGGVRIDSTSGIAASHTGIVIDGPTFAGGITNAGTISASGDGVLAGGSLSTVGFRQGASVTISTFGDGIVNAGTILAGGNGILAGGRAITENFTNNALVAISTFSGGIVNTGTISAGGNGILVGGDANTINVSAFDLATVALSAFGGGITNSGVISARGSAGILVGGNAGIFNGASTGATVAIASFGGGIVNTGTISAAAAGIFVGGNASANGTHNTAIVSISTFGGGITNTGLISAGGAGIFVGGNAGIVSGYTNIASVTISTFSGGISNAGTILAGGAGILVSGSSITFTFNSASVKISSFGGGITNTGLISAGGAGILVGGNGITISTFSGNIDNAGTIIARTGIVIAQRLIGFNGSVVNSGTITATGGTAIDVSAAGLAVTIDQAAGLIAGDIKLSANADVLNISGGAINGNVVGQGAANTVAFAPVAAPFIYASPYAMTGLNQIDFNSGTAYIDGSIQATAIAINNGGTAAGTGTFTGPVTVNSGGTLAPGTQGGYGTLNITGSLTFASDSFYAIDIAPGAGNNSKVVLTGAAALGRDGTVEVTPQLGHYAAGIVYQILTTTSGLTGTFAGLTVNGDHSFAASLDYTTNGPNDVDLDITASGYSLLTAPAGLNQNQQNVLNGINNAILQGDAIPTGFLNLGNLSGPALINALTQLEGQSATGAETSTFQLMTEFLNLLTDPSSGGGANPTGGGAPGFAPEQDASLPSDIAQAYASILSKAPPQQQSFDQRWTAWGAAFGGAGKLDGDPSVGSNGVTASDYGYAAGMDYHATPNSVYGFALSGGGTNWTVAQALGSGRSDSFQVGVHDTTHWGPLYVSGALAFANHWFTTNRIAVGDQLQARFEGQSYAVRGEAGYRYALPVTNAIIGVTPYAALQVQDFHTQGFSETDLTGGGLGLSFAAMNATDTRSELGARFDNLQVVDGMPLVLRARLAWAHDWVSNPSLGAVFQALPGSNFTVNGAAVPENSALTTAAAELHINAAWTAIAKFDGEFAQTAQTYAGTGTLRYSW